MCMDTERELIYLFGGYDGEKSLNDFWEYDVKEERWRVLSHNVVDEKNGPGPRACHKMVFDQQNGCIYMLGRLGDGDVPSQEPPSSEQNQASTAESGASAEQTQGPVQSAWRHRQSASANGEASNTPAAETTSGETGQPAQSFFSEFHRYRARGLDQGTWELLNVDTTVRHINPMTIYCLTRSYVDGQWPSIDVRSSAGPRLQLLRNICTRWKGRGWRVEHS